MDEVSRATSLLTELDVKHTKAKLAMPQPRTLTEVSSERIKEKTQEALAPKTGYIELDYIVKGFIPGHLYTLTGDENVGKTSLACNFTVRITKQRKRVLYFALEPENTVVEYLASVRTNKEFGDLTEEDIRYDDGYTHIYGKDAVRTAADLVKIITSLPRYDLVVIDHIGYFVKGEKGDTNQEQSNVIKELAGLSKRKQCAIMMIAHLRKRPAGQKKKRTILSDDIAGSAAFKQDSTEVMIVVRDFVEDDGANMQYADTGRLHVTKTKAGPNGSIQLHFTDKKANIQSDQEHQMISGLEQYATRGLYSRNVVDNYDLEDDTDENDSGDAEEIDIFSP